MLKKILMCWGKMEVGVDSCLAAQNTRDRNGQYSSTDHFFLVGLCYQ